MSSALGLVYQGIRIPYRFAVGTLSGGVEWVVYLAAPLAAYKFSDEIAAGGSSGYKMASRYIPQLPQKETLVAKANSLPSEASPVVEKMYSALKALTRFGGAWSPSIFDKVANNADGSGTTTSGLVTVATQGLEKHTGSLSQYTPVFKYGGMSYGAYKLGYFEVTAVLSKLVKSSINSALFVEGDPYGLFDLHHIAYDVAGFVTTKTVATLSKVGYISGVVLPAVTQTVLVATAQNYRHEGIEKMSLDAIHSNVVTNKAYYGAGAVVTTMYNWNSIHTSAQCVGKGLETWFEHTMGLVGDEAGLLG